MTTSAQNQLITWSDQYSVGIARIDGEHRKLVELINDLYSAMLEGRGRTSLGRVLDGVADYTRTHFVNEERLMRIHNYPGLDTHKAEHDRLIAKVKILQDDQRSGKPAVSVEVMRFLKAWLMDHIQGMDKKTAAHLLAAGVK